MPHSFDSHNDILIDCKQNGKILYVPSSAKENILDADIKHQGEKRAQHTGPHKFEMEAWISCAPFERLLNIKIIEAAKGRATLTMPFLVEFAQGAGLLHGGALVSLADTAVVMAIKSIISPETHFATISLETKFLYPVKQGVVTAKAKVMHQSDKVLRGFATVYNEDNRAVLEFSSIFKIAKERRIRDIVFQDGANANLD